ncbi:MAG: hypothetical protein PHF56_12435 [Desulfuromonadaceae bacterium]|nr:hypothetical protein [Desulfuromonadaceae bacterium]
MLSHDELAELLRTHAMLYMPGLWQYAVRVISLEDIPKNMPMEEIIDKIKNMPNHYISAEDLCEDSVFDITNPFTGVEYEFYGLQGCGMSGPHIKD